MPVATTVPVVERIREAIVARLETILEPDVEQTELDSVIEPQRIGTWSPRDLQVVVAMGDTEEIEELSYPGNPPAVCYETRYDLVCHIMPDENDDAAKATFIHRLEADVRKIICTPSATWHNWNELAIDSNFGPKQQINGTGGIDGIIVPLLVRYRTDEGNPYVPRT